MNVSEQASTYFAQIGPLIPSELAERRGKLEADMTAAQSVLDTWSKESTLPWSDVEFGFVHVSSAWGPWLAYHLVLGLCRDLVDAGTASRAVISAWSSSRNPTVLLPEQAWRALFEEIGYTVDGEPADPPEVALTLYRGAAPSHHRGWSWSADLDIATAFANNNKYLFADTPLRDQRVWVAVVPPGQLLAQLVDLEYRELEYVVDPTGLDIQAVNPDGRPDDF